MKKLLVFCILLIVAHAHLNAQMLDSLSVSVLDSLLNYLHLEKAELGFEKAWVKDDTFKLKKIDYLLANPLQLPAFVEKTQAEIDRHDPLAMLDFATLQLDLRLEKNQLPPATDPVELLKNTLAVAEKQRQKALQNLDAWELHDLIMSAPALWADEDDPDSVDLVGAWQREFLVEVDTSRTVDKDRLLEIIKKIDRIALHQSGAIFLQTIWHLYQNVDWDTLKMIPPPQKPLGVQGEILAYHQTAFGDIIVGSRGDNIYSRDFAVIIDLGGDDLYRCRAGGALGGLGNPFSAVIDYGGNDIYVSGEKSVSLGAGFLGCGILIDDGGNDIYQGSDYSVGVGLFGTGILFDADGTDDYRGGVFCQAAANVGIGMLFDRGIGDDRYSAAVWAQGLGSVFGYGLLYDEGGNDVYRTGGAYLHAPLLPEDYQSFAQGFGMGWRPRAGGGIGVLYDKSGNDFYNGEVYCQGSAYWYSLGILIDGGGQDVYNAAQYGQGAGIHLAVGALWDQGGDDLYSSRNGVIGGTAHDLSVGMLVDDAGDDHYIVSGGYGVALTNSFALFIDKLGDDMYSTWEDHSFGSVRWGRGFAGCGIFIDLEGNDRYSRNTLADNGKMWTYNDWGIGIDLDRNIIASAREEPITEIILTAEDSLRSVEELFAEASLWQVGSNKQKVARAIEAFKAKGMDGVKFICENKLATDNSLELRLIDMIAESYPDSIAPLLLQKIKDKDEKAQKNAIRLLGISKNEIAVEPLIKMLKKKRYYDLRRSLIAALGSIGDKTATAEIIRFINDNDERCRLMVVSAVSSLKDDSAVPALIKALNDEIFTVRSAALSSLRSFKNPQTADLLLNQFDSSETRYPELIIKAISIYLQTTSDSTTTFYEQQRSRILTELEKLAANDNELIRAEALCTLWQRGDEQHKDWAENKMTLELNPFVRARWEEVRE
jgi:HEAT repeat protein